MLEAGTIVDRYEVVRPLGEGGMAKVWLVRHTTLGSLHALKVLQMTGPSLRDRFLEEGRQQSALRHENIVRVSDVLEVEGLPALVLDYVDGPDLQLWIQRERPDPVLAEAVFRGILAGVQHAHRAGLVHRDLKPANVLMARGADGGLVPKVADFGLAKVVAGDDSRGFQTRAGHPMGTPRYMAPEQIRDASKADFRSDLFALGAILYELLAHEPAYDGPDLVSIFQAVGSGQRAPLPAAVPPHLRRVVDGCLSLDPLHRPNDVAAIVAMLDAGRREPAPPTLAARAAIPVAVWLGAWAIVGGFALLAALAVVGVFLSTRGDDPDGPCTATAGVIGVVKAPTLFTKRTGDSWLLREETQVWDGVPSAGSVGEPVCRLPAGTRVTLTTDTTTVGRDRWVVVDAGAIAAPVKDDPAMGAEREACKGDAGEQVGWIRTRPKLFSGTPRAGGTWAVSAGREVYAEPPPEGEDPKLVCVVGEAVTLRLTEDPVRVGRDWWLPFVLPE